MLAFGETMQGDVQQMALRNVVRTNLRVWILRQVL